MNVLDLPFGIVDKLQVVPSAANARHLDYNDVRCPELGGDLHHAAALGDVRRVEQILHDTSRHSGELAKLAMVASVNFAGQTALHLGSRSGAGDVVGCLLVARADVHAIGDRGETPLHEAAATPEMHRSLEVAWRLIDAGARVNQPDHVGNTPLHYASCGGFASICSLLVERHANPSAMNRAQLSPVDLARSCDHHAVVWRLREFHKLGVCLDVPLSYDSQDVQVWVPGNAPTAEICGRLSRKLPGQVHASWSLNDRCGSNLCWHGCELERRSGRSSSYLSGSDFFPGRWEIPQGADDFRPRNEWLHMRIMPSGSSSVAAHTALGSPDNQKHMRACHWESQPWRIASASKYAQLDWSVRDGQGWSTALLPKGDTLSTKISRVFSDSNTPRFIRCIRLLRHESWQQQFETMLSVLMGASPQNVSDDSGLQSTINYLHGLHSAPEDIDHAYQMYTASAFRSTGRECHGKRYVELPDGRHVYAEPKNNPEFFDASLQRYHDELCTTLDETTKGFGNLHFALVWQGAASSKNLCDCLDDPASVQKDLFGLPSHVHLAKSVDYVEGCRHRPSFLHSGSSESEDVDGTVFLFVLASRFVFPSSPSRSYTRYFDPEADVYDERYLHRGLALIPGFDGHVFHVRGGKAPAHTQTRNCSYASMHKKGDPIASQDEADEFVVMHPAQLLPIAAVDFSTHPTKTETDSRPQFALPKCPDCCVDLLSFANTSAVFCEGCNQRCPQGRWMGRCESCDFQRCHSCLIGSFV